MEKITRARWNALKRHGYTSIIDGQRYILQLNDKTGGTELVPVTVCGCSLCK